VHVIPVLLREIALQREVRGKDAAFQIHPVQRVEMPAHRRLLYRRESPQREELAAQGARVLSPESLLVRSSLEIEAADRPVQVGDFDSERDEIDGDLVVPGRRGSEEDGVILGLRELESVIGVDEDRAGDRPPLEE